MADDIVGIKPEVDRIIRGAVAEAAAVGIDEVKLEATLTDYGLDSIDAVMIANALEDALNVSVEPAMFYKHPNFRAVSDDLAETLAKRACVPVSCLKDTSEGDNP